MRNLELIQKKMDQLYNDLDVNYQEAVLTMRQMSEAGSPAQEYTWKHVDYPSRMWYCWTEFTADGTYFEDGDDNQGTRGKALFEEYKH